MKTLSSLVAITLSFLGFNACQQQWQSTSISEEPAVAAAPIAAASQPADSPYLSLAELHQFIREAAPLQLGDAYQPPFDTLAFDKVIAYDYDGRGGRYESVISRGNEDFVPVVLRQVALNVPQIDRLLGFMTDSRSYGQYTAACFDPHLAFVFYQGNVRQLVVDVCLDCNFLESTLLIPATEHHQKAFDEGTSYPLRGFSEAGRTYIIELSRELGLDYGKLGPEAVKPPFPKED